MEWINAPSKWIMGGNMITVTADPGTDVWRQPGAGGIRNNAHFYHHEVTGDFTAHLELEGDFRGQFDQAGIMVRADDACWLKCGIEFVDGRRCASVAITREWSDWSLAPTGETPSYNFSLERHGGIFKVYYAPFGEEPSLLRKAWLTDSASLHCGIMIASPKGGGFEATFQGFRIETE
ncbi:MAG: DUF1349 domain-containing protein [Candidatus Latescibacteria bacterium]|nr:DUF1349 domain-containing protein [Candidatus Latescibacterota bacterium]